MSHTWVTAYGTNFACTQLGSGALVRPLGKSILLLQNVENSFKCYRPDSGANRYPTIPQEISEYQEPQLIQLKYGGGVIGNYACQYCVYSTDTIYQQSHFILRAFHPRFTIASSSCTWYPYGLTMIKRLNYMHEILLGGLKPYFEQHDRTVYGSVSKTFMGFWGLIPPSYSPVEIYHEPANSPQQILIGVAYTDQYGFFSLNIDSPILYNRAIPYGDKVSAFCFEKLGYPQVHIPYAGGEQIHFRLQGVPDSQDKMYPVICKTDFQPDSNGNTLRI